MLHESQMRPTNSKPRLCMEQGKLYQASGGFAWTAEANIRCTGTNPKTSGITVNQNCLSADADLMLPWRDKPDPAALPSCWETHQRPPANASGRR